MAENRKNTGRPAAKSSRIAFETLPYAAQLAKKQERAEKLLSPFCLVQPVLGMEDPLHYRAKVHAAFARDDKGRVVCGEYKEGTHRVIEKKDSPIEDAVCRKIIRTVKSLVISFRIRIYDEDLRTGLLRHVVVRRAFSTGEVMVVLVTAERNFPSRVNFVKALLEKHPEITTIVQNVNSRRTSIVLGDREEVLFGKGYIEEKVCGCTFRLSASSFFQVNPVQMKTLYETALSFARLTKDDRVIDAYCGTGTIGIIAAKGSEAAVLGIERNGEAVRDARKNAKENGIENISFIEGDAAEYMERLAERKKNGGKSAAGADEGTAGETAHPTVLLMDPPREGASERFLAAAAALEIPRIVYISCGIETLARDLAYLKARGYRVKKIRPVDMFPFTEEIETVVQLSKGRWTSGGRPFSADRSGAETISSENSKSPGTPKEKEEAIIDAFRHFQMF